MREKDFPKLKFYVSIPGDESVGIFPGEAIVTIQDNCNYETEENVNDLKQSIASMYDVSPEYVRTELEEYRGRLRDLIIELNTLLSQIDDLGLSEADKSRELNEYRRIMLSKKKNLQDDIRFIKKFYDKNKFFYKKLAQKV